MKNGRWPQKKWKWKTIPILSQSDLTTKTSKTNGFDTIEIDLVLHKISKITFLTEVHTNLFHAYSNHQRININEWHIEITSGLTTKRKYPTCDILKIEFLATKTCLSWAYVPLKYFLIFEQKLKMKLVFEQKLSLDLSNLSL